MSSLPNLKNEDFAKVIASSANKLEYLDLSFNAVAEINNALMIKVSVCPKL